jgi:hypothetical protein
MRIDVFPTKVGHPRYLIQRSPASDQSEAGLPNIPISDQLLVRQAKACHSTIWNIALPFHYLEHCASIPLFGTSRFHSIIRNIAL